jgi:hypothetical protein
MWSGPGDAFVVDVQSFASRFAAVGIAGIVVALAWPRAAVASIAGLCGILVFTFSDMRSSALPPHAFRALFNRTMENAARVEAVRDNRPVRFWIAKNDVAEDDYRALNSVYLDMWSGLSSSFPALSCEPTIRAGTVLVVLSNRPNVAETAQTELSTCLKNKALRAKLLSVTSNTAPQGNYTLAILGSEPDPMGHSFTASRENPQRLTLQIVQGQGARMNLPLRLWTAYNPHGDTALQTLQDGIGVITPPAAWATAAEYGPFIAPADGRYRFTLNYTLVSGKFVFGIRYPADPQWLDVDVQGYSAGKNREMTVGADLKCGKEYVIQIANDNTAAPSSLVVHELAGMLADPGNSP